MRRYAKLTILSNFSKRDIGIFGSTSKSQGETSGRSKLIHASLTYFGMDKFGGTSKHYLKSEKCLVSG